MDAVNSLEGKWTWNESTDGDYWNHDTFDTQRDAMLDAYDNGVRDNVYVGQVKCFIPSVDAEDILEALRCQAGDECGESSDGYLDSVSKESEADLTERLQKVFDEWVVEHDQQPNFYSIDNVKLVSLEEVMY